MTKHTVKTIASGEYSCSCGAVWDRDEGSECPNSGGTSETPAQLGTRLHAEMQEAIENSATMRQPLEEIAERAAFEAWRIDKFCGGTERLKKCSNAPDVYFYTAEQEAWDAWQARAALTASAPSHGEQVRSREDWGVFASYLLDKCEGETISEEFLQRTLHSMFHDPHYGALFRGEKAPSAGSQEQGE